MTDANHREYSYTIDAWGGWGAFQRLLHVLRRIADRHEVASIATVAIAYLLSLPRMLAVIVGAQPPSPPLPPSHHPLSHNQKA